MKPRHAGLSVHPSIKLASGAICFEGRSPDGHVTERRPDLVSSETAVLGIPFDAMEENGMVAEGKANGAAGSDAPPPVPPAADASSAHLGPRQRAKAKTQHLDIVAEAYSVASKSTAHGVWRIFDRRRRWANRICWAFLWLTAFSLFVTYLVLQTEYLASFPTSTLITQVFVSPTPFPAVSVCISSLNRTTVAAFLRPPRGSTVLEQVADIFNGSGVACFYGLHTARQLLRYEIPSDGSGCSARSTVSFVDYPFAWSPTLCITTPGDLVADQPGYTLTIVGRVPGLGVLDQLTYGIRQADAQFQPMLANLLSTGIHTRERFHIGTTRNIRNCDPQPGGQPKCLADFQQQCVEKACSCRYPAVAGNVSGSSLSDLVEQLPGWGTAGATVSFRMVEMNPDPTHFIEYSHLEIDRFSRHRHQPSRPAQSRTPPPVPPPPADPPPSAVLRGVRAPAPSGKGVWVYPTAQRWGEPADGYTTAAGAQVLDQTSVWCFVQGKQIGISGMCMLELLVKHRPSGRMIPANFGGRHLEQGGKGSAGVPFCGSVLFRETMREAFGNGNPAHPHVSGHAAPDLSYDPCGALLLLSFLLRLRPRAVSNLSITRHRPITFRNCC
ncbi:hypothetical protein DFJ74DRAFT_686730 [Hyaloraphidium curvatum]|nr:hypothetical protein DFJ74DRAFT_686730 [Hyaloraphidium curvatum]